MTANGMTCELQNRQRKVKVDTRSLKRFLKEAARDVAPVGVGATLVLVGDASIHALNRAYRGLDQPTDVLSFPAGADGSVGGESYLGDIVISVETARRQARRRGNALLVELKVLALHGLLHLLGYDHETDAGEMRRVEYRIRRQLGITRPRPRRR